MPSRKWVLAFMGFTIMAWYLSTGVAYTLWLIIR